MKKILAIGGAVMKTEARQYLWEVADDIEMLLLNGGALFHDFQMALEGYTSVPLDELNESMERIEFSCMTVCRYVSYNVKPPQNSFVAEMRKRAIPVLLFTAPGCDYWQKFLIDWSRLGKKIETDFMRLQTRLRFNKFHFINMCSAVIMPEVFQKAIQGISKDYIRADVVDFLEMYRPRTRVARYGEYYQMDVVEYMKKWSKEVISNGSSDSSSID